jgi:hypothetical protein
MKKTQYHCTKCKSKTNFLIRNVGKLPEIIGCKITGCGGRSIEWNTIDENDTEIDGVFFSPKTNIEWNAIKQQCRFESKTTLKGKSRREVRATIRKVIENFENHVKKGGLLFLPKEYFSETIKSTD